MKKNSKKTAKVETDIDFWYEAQYQYKCRLCGEVDTQQFGGWSNDMIAGEMFIVTHGDSPVFDVAKIHKIQATSYHLCKGDGSFGVCDFIGVKKVLQEEAVEPIAKPIVEQTSEANIICLHEIRGGEKCANQCGMCAAINVGGKKIVEEGLVLIEKEASMDRYTKYKAAFPNKTDRQCIESLSAEVSDKVEAIGNLLSEIAELKNKPSNPASQFCEKAMRFASWISDNGLCSFSNKEGELMFFTNLKSEDDIPCDLVLRQFEDGVTKFRNTKKEDSSK